MVGTAYGVILNDRDERAELAGAFAAPPYGAPPVAPVLYIKPRGTFAFDDAPVTIPAGLASLTAAATIALVLGTDGTIAGARLALDVSEPHASYFRPAVRERCRDGFLPLGAAGACPGDQAVIVTSINGAQAHSWSLERLVRPVVALVAEIADFMTFAPGDLLMVGLAGDAPTVVAGDRVEARCDGLPTLSALFVAEDRS